MLEQLPLSLHRTFTLIQELDQQAQGTSCLFHATYPFPSHIPEHISNISPAILKYVSLRRAIDEAAKGRRKQREQQPGHEQLNGGVGGDSHAAGPSTSSDAPDARPAVNGKLPNGTGTTASPTSITSPSVTSAKDHTPPLTTQSLATLAQTSNSTREILVGIAQSAEQVARASHEKDYLAQHAYDLVSLPVPPHLLFSSPPPPFLCLLPHRSIAQVDRYIRDLNRAIKEQETSISLGLRPGTHPASIMLPELVLPKATRPRVVTSPPPTEIPPEYAPIEPESVGQPVPARIEEPGEAPEAQVPAGEEAEGASEQSQEPVGLKASSSAPEEEAVETVDDESQQSAPPTSGLEPDSTPDPATHGRRGRKRRKPARYRQDPSPERPTASARKAPPAEPSSSRGRRSLLLKIPAQVQVQPEPEPEANVVVDVEDEDDQRWCFCNQVSFGEVRRH